MTIRPTPKTMPAGLQNSVNGEKAEASISPVISQELEEVLHKCFVDARNQRHLFITLEHLLLALANSESVKETIIACGADIEVLKASLNAYIDDNSPKADASEEIETQPSLGFQRSIQRAIMHVQINNKKGLKVLCNDVLIAVFGEKDSHAVYYLHRYGVTRQDVINFVAQGICKVDIAPEENSKSHKSAEKTAIDRDLRALVSLASQPYVSINTKKGDKPKLFISYCHADSACLERLLVHLKPLERSNTVIAWSDRRIRIGDKWKAELEQSLDDAVIAILLVSADFLASDFIVNNELPPLLIKADAKGLRILPVILKPCGFRRDPVLSTFQAANDPATPLLGMPSMEQELIYDKIADEVEKEIFAHRR